MNVYIPMIVIWIFCALFGIGCVLKALDFFLRLRIKKLERLIDAAISERDKR